MKQICALASKASLCLFLMCIIMLFWVNTGSAEWVVSIVSAIMMAVVFTVSVILLRKTDDEDQK